ncbi:MAG: hypothetical protein ABI868_14425 [Acidobacteriota bacterium]
MDSAIAVAVEWPRRSAATTWRSPQPPVFDVGGKHGERVGDHRATRPGSARARAGPWESA